MTEKKSVKEAYAGSGEFFGFTALGAEGGELEEGGGVVGVEGGNEEVFLFGGGEMEGKGVAGREELEPEVAFRTEEDDAEFPPVGFGGLVG